MLKVILFFANCEGYFDHWEMAQLALPGELWQVLHPGGKEVQEPLHLQHLCLKLSMTWEVKCYSVHWRSSIPFSRSWRSSNYLSLELSLQSKRKLGLKMGTFKWNKRMRLLRTANNLKTIIKNKTIKQLTLTSPQTSTTKQSWSLNSK